MRTADLIVGFTALTLVITAVVLSVFNQRLERRTTLVVEEYIRDITLATDIVYQSFSRGEYIYNLVNRGLNRGGNRGEEQGLTIDSESVIGRILVVDQDGLVFDSSDRSEIGRRFSDLMGEVPRLEPGDLRPDAGVERRDPSRTLGFSIETERGVRRIFIVVSLSRLNRVKESGERIRLMVLAGLGLVMIAAIVIFTRRLTGSIVGLGEAARRVTEGEIDFQVPVGGPREARRLAGAFNEMLAGLRRNRSLEEELQRAERSAVVGRLASGIAHEIRNPLNFINLSIDYLREKYAPSEAGGRGEYTAILTTIKDELARLNRLVSDFLSYGRPMKLRRREVGLRTLVEEVGGLVATRMAQQSIRLEIIAPPEGEVTILADPEQLRTCFSNLMINAVEAMPEGGRLIVAIRRHDAEASIDFTDTGHGMPPENVGQIFEPYFSTKETGVGLGLALTRRIIEEHGGRISVTSSPGAGTTFHLSGLPIITSGGPSLS